MLEPEELGCNFDPVLWTCHVLLCAMYSMKTSWYASHKFSNDFAWFLKRFTQQLKH